MSNTKSAMIDEIHFRKSIAEHLIRIYILFGDRFLLGSHRGEYCIVCLTRVVTNRCVRVKNLRVLNQRKPRGVKYFNPIRWAQVNYGQPVDHASVVIQKLRLLFPSCSKAQRSTNVYEGCLCRLSSRRFFKIGGGSARVVSSL